MKRIMNLSFAFLFFLVLFTVQARADVKLPAVFGDNMVLQQQSQVAVWGWARPLFSLCTETSCRALLLR